MLVLSQFVLRLSSGLALAMAITSPKQVSSGFFRNHSYVLLGLSVLATLAALGSGGQIPWWQPLAAAVLSYACAVGMLYEKPKLGTRLLALVFGISVANAVATQTVLGSNGIPTPLVESHICESAKVLWYSNVVSSAGLLGFTIAAMFLGHWYLNAPEMNLDPLRRLLVALSSFIVMRAICSGLGLALELSGTGLSTTQWILVSLRWLAGIFGTAALAAMAWQTLKIPNTQSATGILYVAVITTFLGELTSLLLSRGTAFPL
jgi:hypothetical protein